MRYRIQFKHASFPFLTLLCSLMLCLPVQAQSETQAGIQTLGKQNQEYQTIDWIDLLPPADLLALQNAPPISHGGELADPGLAAESLASSAPDDIPFGSEFAEGTLQTEGSQLAEGSQSSEGSEFTDISDDFFDLETDFAEDAFQAALVSTNIVEAFNGQSVRVPGFIVPVEYDDDLTITEFFVVPYFGACIHMPPPPPNQIIYVTYEQGFKLDNLYTPFWISGEMNTGMTTNALGTSAYSLQMDSFELYTE